MSTARRHHFVPQFYLREWHGPDGSGFWLYYRDRNGEVRLRRRPAKSIAYLDNLYSLVPDGLIVSSSVEPDLVETAFFSKVDHDAAKAHEKILVGGLGSLDAEEKSSFAIFLISLLERHPERIKEHIEHAREIFRTNLQADPRTSNTEVLLRNLVLKTMAECIVDLDFVRYLLEMRWLMVTLPYQEEHFLTSDKPILINGGKGLPSSPIHLLSMALSPQHLLILHSDDEDFDEEFVTRITIMHSALITMNADKHLISSRRVTNSRFIKYERIVMEMLGKKSHA